MLVSLVDLEKRQRTIRLAKGSDLSKEEEDKPPWYDKCYDKRNKWYW